MKLVFIGPPGAGKGTQATNICKTYGIVHISTGDILREERKNKTELGKLAQSYIDKGALVPDDVIIGIVKNRISADDCKDGFLFDGFPRTLEQAKALDQLVDLDAVVNLVVPDAALMDRLCGRRVCKQCAEPHHISTMPQGNTVCKACGGELVQRPDDSPETIGNRLKVFHAQTSPLIDFYTAKGICLDIDGTQGIEAVGQAICKALDER